MQALKPDESAAAEDAPPLAGADEVVRPECGDESRPRMEAVPRVQHRGELGPHA